MKSGVLPIALLVTALAVLAPVALGLQCYTCLSFRPDGAPDPHDKNNLYDEPPEYHENCFSGPFTDSFLQTCTRNNSLSGNLPNSDHYKFECGSVRRVAGNAGNTKVVSSRSCVWVVKAAESNRCINIKEAETKKENDVKRHIRDCHCPDDKCNTDTTDWNTGSHSALPSYFIYITLLTFQILKF